MSLSKTQSNATQKLLEHIRSTPPKDAAPTLIPPLQKKAASRRLLFGGERSVVGIDVSKDRISLVQRRAGHTPILEAVYTTEAPGLAGWETPGCADKVRNALNAFMPNSWDSAQLWIHLPEASAELRHYSIPKVDAKDRDAIAKMAASREKPFDEKDNLFDYRVNGEVLNHGVSRLPVTAMVADKKALALLREKLAEADIPPTGITSSSICLQNLFASGWLSSPWAHFAIVNIEEDSTSIDIFSGLTIALSRTIKTGLHSLVSALQDAQEDSPLRPAPDTAPATGATTKPTPDKKGYADSEQSPSLPSDLPFPLLLQPTTQPLELSLAGTPEHVRVSSGEPNDALSYEEGVMLLCGNKNRTADEEATLIMQLSQPLGRLARQLERTADHFRNTMKMPGIEGILVFAPDGCLPLALKKFEKTLGLPCRPLRFDGQATPGAATDLHKAMEKTADSNLLHAIGLSLSASDYTPNAIMTYEDQRIREKRMLITFLSFGVTTLALALLLAFCGKMYTDYLDAKRYRAELETSIASRGTIYTPEQLKANLGAMQTLQVLAQNMAKRRIAAALMTELSVFTPPSIYLTGLRVTFKNAAPNKQASRPPQRGVARNPVQEENAVAVLTGTVTGNLLQRESQLAEFLSQLEHSPMVHSLLVEKQQTDTEILSFVATLRLV